ncbi:hypothetical protein NPIL_105961 [Nephila pilipes]|uniref:Uncharacterized protein n=1 Tax=Nephila pilipes TaxID=299642 RepID=A0A8X6UQJ6_NEPPI|nr:hypothetical protein NPIL_105961 [Nephila pilipes]
MEIARETRLHLYVDQQKTSQTHKFLLPTLSSTFLSLFSPRILNRRRKHHSEIFIASPTCTALLSPTSGGDGKKGHYLFCSALPHRIISGYRGY